jgi:hypothetical protein
VTTLNLLGGGAGVIAVVAFAHEKKNRVAGAGELAGAPRNAFADAANHLGFGLTGGPGGGFPCAHLGDAYDGYRHEIYDLRLMIEDCVSAVIPSQS